MSVGEVLQSTGRRAGIVSAIAFFLYISGLWNRYKGGIIHWTIVNPIRAITPASIVFGSFFVVKRVWKMQHLDRRVKIMLLLKTILGSLAIAEVSFYFWYLWSKRKLNMTRPYSSELIGASNEQKLKTLNDQLEAIEQVYSGGDHLVHPDDEEEAADWGAKSPRVEPLSNLGGSTSMRLGTSAAVSGHGLTKSGGLTRVTSAPMLNDFKKGMRRQFSVEDLVRHNDDVNSSIDEGFSQSSSAADMATDLKTFKRADVIQWYFWESSGRTLYMDEFDELQYDNIKEFLACYYFTVASISQLSKYEEKGVNALVDRICEWCEFTPKRGINPKICARRLLTDPVDARHRPLSLIWTTSIVAPVAEALWLQYLGFHEFQQGQLTYWYRPANAMSMNGKAALWRRPPGFAAWQPDDQDDPDAKTKPLPVVFAHGIGVGILMYTPFIIDIMKHFPVDTDIFLISFPHISVRWTSVAASFDEVSFQVATMLRAWGFEKAHFISHSFGSLIIPYALRNNPEMVACVTLLDPVCIFIWKVTLAVYTNFLSKLPSSPLDIIVRYFGIMELHTASRLKTLDVLHNVYPKDLNVPTLVCLCKDDAIVPAYSIRRLVLREKRRPHPQGLRAQMAPQIPSLELFWMEEFGHGGFLATPSERLYRRLSTFHRKNVERLTANNMHNSASHPTDLDTMNLKNISIPAPEKREAGGAMLGGKPRLGPERSSFGDLQSLRK